MRIWFRLESIQIELFPYLDDFRLASKNISVFSHASFAASGAYLSPDEITFYDKDSEFAVNITGDWKGRSPVVIVVKETLENIDEITSVRAITVFCS